ncbi:MAG: nucleotidyltransferase [Candidatus Bathyarchaeota archaeon]|nr:nucleotidyltransferase [Candidatus Bathyarchaeota archaeon]
MVLSEAQLQTWSNKGAVTTSINAHQSIRTALLSDNSPIKGRTMDFYLQGSYKNDTNVRGDSDVDVVIQLDDVFYSDTSQLNDEQRNLHRAAFPDAAYNYWNFRADVLKALTDYYGIAKIRAGNKSIKLAGDTNRVNADVVPCVQYRRYKRFQNITDQDYVEGMLFFTQSEQRQIINYPKKHYENGCTKSDKTDGWFKQTVRVLKNARSKLVDDGIIAENLAPSYFVECLTYNVPNAMFGGNWQSTYYNSLNWLAKADFNNFACQSEQTYLFGTSPEQWNITNAKILVEKLLAL